MPVLTLDYRHCDRKRPKYIKHVEVEAIAALARQQLVAANVDAISFDVLRQITGLKINGTDFSLEVSTDYAVHDEHGNPVLGICEFDAVSPNTAMISISPVSETFSEPLALSTFAHELGHAVFDAPGWVCDGGKGQGLSDSLEPATHRVCCTTMLDGEHLDKMLLAKPMREAHFAELRANEFMGSLLVPRQRLDTVVEELAPKYGVTFQRCTSLDPDHPGTVLCLTAGGGAGFFDKECLEKALASRFGVNRRFIQVRLQRYGLTGQEVAVR